MRRATRAVLVALAVAAAASAACTNAGEDNLPVNPSGGPFTPAAGKVVVGGGGGGGGGTAVVQGRVCVIQNDASALGDCAAKGAGGLTVALGGSTTTTADNGTFSMPAPQGTNLTFHVTGANIVPSAQAFSPGNVIPAMNQQLFDQVLADNGIVLTPGSGSIFASVVDRGGQPVQGVTVTSTPSPAFGPYYDGTQPTPWTLDATGARGVIFLPGLDTVGPTGLTFTDSGTSSETTVGGVQVVDGGITFVDTVLP